MRSYPPARLIASTSPRITTLYPHRNSSSPKGRSVHEAGSTPVYLKPSPPPSHGEHPPCDQGEHRRHHQYHYGIVSVHPSAPDDLFHVRLLYAGGKSTFRASRMEAFARVTAAVVEAPRAGWGWQSTGPSPRKPLRPLTCLRGHADNFCGQRSHRREEGLMPSRQPRNALPRRGATDRLRRSRTSRAAGGADRCRAHDPSPNTSDRPGTLAAGAPTQAAAAPGR